MIPCFSKTPGTSCIMIRFFNLFCLIYFQMSPMINEQIDKFLNVMDDKCIKEEEFDIYE